MQDTQLRLQGLRHSAHQVGEVFSAGGVIVHSPGEEETGQRKPCTNSPPLRDPRSLSPRAHGATPCWVPWPGYKAPHNSTYFLLADRAMCVPLLKSTATRRLDS